MAQLYHDIQPTELISQSLSKLMGNFETIISNSSATSFPVENLFHGMFCFRTDENKLYILLDPGLPNWYLLYDFTDPLVSMSFLVTQLATKQNLIGSGSALQNLVNSLLAPSRAVITDSAGRLAAGTVTAGEVQALAGVAGNVQVQFGNKQNKITISAAPPSGGVDGDIWLQVQ